MFQEGQLCFILAVILCSLCGSSQRQIDSTGDSQDKTPNCDDEPSPIIVNFRDIREASKQFDHLSQLVIGQYSNMTAALEDVKEESNKLEQKLMSLELKLDKMEQRNLGLLQLLVQNALPNLNQQLYEASKKGETKRVVHLLTTGVSTDYEDSNKNRPIHVATENSHAEVIQALLDNKADPNVHGQYDYAPIHWTSYNGCLSCAKILLAHGALVDSRDKWQDTPLIKSAKYGYTDLVKLLLDKEADVNAAQEWKYTALHMAARDGRIETATVLVDHGADVNMKTKDGKTALDFAVEKNNHEIVGLLKSRLKI